MNRNFARLDAENGVLLLCSTYTPEFVGALKAAVPASGRRWDANRKAWSIAPMYGSVVAQVVRTQLGVDVHVPDVGATAAMTTRLTCLEYLGTAKDHGDGALTAYGYAGDNWSLVFPLAVLKSWFEESSKPDEAPTLYGVLGVKQSATMDEIKKAYRRGALTWHPDINKEPEATEQFIALHDAYEILTSAKMRARYNAGLALQGTLGNASRPLAYARTWRPPLRCGLLLLEGTEQVGRLVVSKILRWDDVVDQQGRVLVTSWPHGAQMFEKRWVTQ